MIVVARGELNIDCYYYDDDDELFHSSIKFLFIALFTYTMNLPSLATTIVVELIDY